MRNYTFWIPIQGSGDNFKEGWNDAMEKLAGSIMEGKEWNDPPLDLFDKNDSIPAAEILGGSLSAGFGFEEGEDEP